MEYFLAAVIIILIFCRSSGILLSTWREGEVISMSSPSRPNWIRRKLIILDAKKDMCVADHRLASVWKAYLINDL